MAWPTKPSFVLPPKTLRRMGPIASTIAASKIKTPPPGLARITFGPVAVYTANEEEVVVYSKTPPPFVKVEAAPTVVAVPISIELSMPLPEAVAGPAQSTTENSKHGLPLPFPSILANPGRLGPPRFNASDRKTLRIKR